MKMTSIAFLVSNKWKAHKKTQDGTSRGLKNVELSVTKLERDN